MDEIGRYRRIFRRVHAGHPTCLRDEWLGAACTDGRGRICDRPIVWSRRNGPWHRHDILFVGAAPGNAGGKGGGALGAHGTRIPFGGDLAGANLDVLLSSIGISRNDTFITAALNHLPVAGGGEPGLTEILAPVGRYPSSLHLLRDTVIACGPRLLVALGNVAARALAAALQLQDDDLPAGLPALARLERAGLRRGEAMPWPTALPPGGTFLKAWQGAWPGEPLPHLLLLTHPSGQNMSPYARVETAFHTRMVAARDALRTAAAQVLGRSLPLVRPGPPGDGIYALSEWRELIAPRHRRLDDLWRGHGV